MLFKGLMTADLHRHSPLQCNHIFSFVLGSLRSYYRSDNQFNCNTTLMITIHVYL